MGRLSADAVVIGSLRSEIRSTREAQFVRSVDAFVDRDFAVIEESMRSDVILQLPGTSWLAGTYRGAEDVSRRIVALRQVFVSDRKLITFQHARDQMTVRHSITVSGPMHDVEMILYLRVEYGRDGKVATIDVVPVDLGLFDYVVNSRLATPKHG